jgi:Lhr-like helicase
LFELVRHAAPFGSLSRAAFEGVLDLLSGRYPSDEFAELRPRLTWDRIRNVVTARDGAARLAILNAGTIPDRGLYGVFLAHSEGKSVRVGELDEEMVFESHPGETFILGASTWRIVEITHDRVLVTPAPGEPGKMPFWKGDGPDGRWSLAAASARWCANCALAQACRAHAACCRARSRSRRSGKPDAVSCRSGGRDRLGARRSHGGDRALPR